MSAERLVNGMDRAARDRQREIAIQRIAELDRGMKILNYEVINGRPRHELLATLRAQRKVLQLLENAAMRDGRPA